MTRREAFEILGLDSDASLNEAWNRVDGVFQRSCYSPFPLLMHLLLVSYTRILCTDSQLNFCLQSRF